MMIIWRMTLRLNILLGISWSDDGSYFNCRPLIQRGNMGNDLLRNLLSPNKKVDEEKLKRQNIDARSVF